MLVDIVKQAEALVAGKKVKLSGVGIEYRLEGDFSSDFCKGKGNVRYHGRLKSRFLLGIPGPTIEPSSLAVYAVYKQILVEICNLGTTKYKVDKEGGASFSFFIWAPVASQKELAEEQNAIADYLGEEMLVEAKYSAPQNHF